MDPFPGWGILSSRQTARCGQSLCNKRLRGLPQTSAGDSPPGRNAPGSAILHKTFLSPTLCSGCRFSVCLQKAKTVFNQNHSDQMLSQIGMGAFPWLEELGQSVPEVA